MFEECLINCIASSSNTMLITHSYVPFLKPSTLFLRNIVTFDHVNIMRNLSYFIAYFIAL